MLRLNEDTYREELLVAGGKPPEAKRGLKIFYGSVHDIVSDSSALQAVPQADSPLFQSTPSLARMATWIASRTQVSTSPPMDSTCASNETSIVPTAR